MIGSIELNFELFFFENIKNFQKSFFEKFKNCFEKLKLDGHLKRNNIEAAAISLEETIKSAMVYNRKRRSRIWFDRECYLKRKSTLQAMHAVKADNNLEKKRQYSTTKKEYKTLLTRKRTEYLEKEAARVIEEAKNDPYVALKPRRVLHSGKIEMSVWEEHFRNILNEEEDGTYTEQVTEGTEQAEINPFTKEEVLGAISSLKNGKAPGPDGIGNEHIKDASEILLPAITEQMNLCLRVCNIPLQSKYYTREKAASRTRTHTEG